MTLNVVPAWSDPTVTTTGCDAATSRLAIVCSSDTSSAAPTIGSTAFSGIAPWPPWPISSMSKRSDDEKNGAVADADLAGLEPAVEMKRERPVDVRVLQRPVVDHQLVAGVAFFAGLEAEDERAGDFVRGGAAARAPPQQQHRHVTVVSARVHYAVDAERYGTSLSSRTGSASMSARSSVTGPGLPPRSVASTPVLPMPVRISSKPARAQLALDELRRFELLERELGMRVKVTPVSTSSSLRTMACSWSAAAPTSGRRIWPGRERLRVGGRF